MLDIMVDADSKIITQVNVLAGAGQEAHDALELIRSEQSAHGNDVQALSMDGAGFDGPVLREAGRFDRKVRRAGRGDSGEIALRRPLPELVSVER